MTAAYNSMFSGCYRVGIPVPPAFALAFVTVPHPQVQATSDQGTTEKIVHGTDVAEWSILMGLL